MAAPPGPSLYSLAASTRVDMPQMATLAGSPAQRRIIAELSNIIALNNIDPNWREHTDNAFAVELLLQPDHLDLPVWLTFKPDLFVTDELINTIIDLDDVTIVVALTNYQKRVRVVGETIDEALRRRLTPDYVEQVNVSSSYIPSGSSLDVYYRGPRPKDDFVNAVRTFPVLTRAVDGATIAQLGAIYNRHIEQVYVFAALQWAAAANGKEALLAKNIRQIMTNAAHERMAPLLYTFYLDHIAVNDPQKWLLLGYAIESTSPVYYARWLDKYGDLTADPLLQHVAPALLQSNFDVWCLEYQPEIYAAIQLAERLTERQRSEIATVD